MALIDLNTMNNEVLPHVPGCPSSVVEAYIRKVIADLCTRALVWQVRLTPFALTPATYSYTLASPVLDTEVCVPISLRYTRADTGVVDTLSVFGLEYLTVEYPSWPEDGDTGAPEAAALTSGSTLEIYPIPDAETTYTVSGVVAIRPSLDATQCEETVLNDYRREIVHGVLHMLMLLPDRKWTDLKTGEYHGKQWNYLLNAARAGRVKGFGRTDVSVQMRPWI